jgi:hypothetical protein
VIGLPGEDNRGVPQALALLAELPVLAAQPPQLLTLSRGEAIMAVAGGELGLAGELGR